MFTLEELQEIDAGYFEIIVSDPYDMMIQYINTVISIRTTSTGGRGC